ncbi:PqqD family protein [Rossellomorea sp. NRS-1567]|uniref:PqqD family protein n=1 Tax=Rossellomorea sp. NRS-1567 TaxID=3233901 RepID=UPI003D2A60F3
MTERYVQRKEYEASQFDDEWIILNTDLYTVTKVNEVGGFCWALLESAQTIDSIAVAVEGHFNITEARAVLKDDIKDFLKELQHYGLVEYAS